MHWRGVIPAITTPFHADGAVDFDFFARHCTWLIDHGCTGIVALGSLGEGATLAFAEKIELLETAAATLSGRAPVVAAISALSTREAIDLARAAHRLGCSGLMILPPYVYIGDAREMMAHISAVLDATPLSAMLYNNPIAYRVDFLPDQVATLAARHANLHAIKESSADVRRIAAVRHATGDAIEILCGVDDLIVEAVHAGATGWIAGLANALPTKSVDLFEAARRGPRDADDLYRWFLPLLRLDTVPKFVQLIKYVQELAGIGSARVRPPRLPLTDDEKLLARAAFEGAMTTRPAHPEPQLAR